MNDAEQKVREPFAIFGRVKVTRIDERNWAVDGGDRPPAYYGRLPNALREAAHRVTDAKARDIREWLAEWTRLTDDFELLLEKFAHLIENKEGDLLVGVSAPKHKKGRPLGSKNRRKNSAGGD